MNQPQQLFVERFRAERPSALFSTRLRSTPKLVGNVELGRIVGNGWELVVKDTQLAGAYVVHLCKAAENMDINIGGTVEVQVDMDDRRLIAANHSATHLLNHALRTTLGSDCDQRGSLCDARRLRFDFACSRSVSDADVAQITATINKQIEQKLSIQTAEVH